MSDQAYYAPGKYLTTNLQFSYFHNCLSHLMKCVEYSSDEISQCTVGGVGCKNLRFVIQVTTGLNCLSVEATGNHKHKHNADTVTHLTFSFSMV